MQKRKSKTLNANDDQADFCLSILGICLMIRKKTQIQIEQAKLLRKEWAC
jgi:hypothetical protein